MSEDSVPSVAILLATYNGGQLIEHQLRSLKQNATAFTLHWIDDHSTDNSRDVVRDTARSAHIDLCDWTPPVRLGYPMTFFRLLELAEADIYCFCDQDDVWQPGKIDRIVAELITQDSTPALCFSDPLVFHQDEPTVTRRFSEILKINSRDNLKESCAFTHTPALGHTIGLTSPLREIFLRHKDIAVQYGFGHDWWMYLVALATGEVRMLADAPTTLWRQHATNFSAPLFRRNIGAVGSFPFGWRLQSGLRSIYARQASGFIAASATFPGNPKQKRLLELANLVAKIDRRQSLVDFFRLIRSGAMPPRKSAAFWLALSCLLTNARLPAKPSAEEMKLELMKTR